MPHPRLWGSLLEIDTGITECRVGSQVFWLHYSHSVYDWEEEINVLGNDLQSMK